MPTTIQYALMAAASYISTRPFDVNKFPVPDGWNVTKALALPGGFEDWEMGTDWEMDWEMGTGKWGRSPDWEMGTEPDCAVLLRACPKVDGGKRCPAEHE